MVEIKELKMAKKSNKLVALEDDYDIDEDN